MRIKQQLVRLWRRPSKDGKSFTYYMRYVDLEGKYHCSSLRHGDSHKAEKQRLKKEKELRMGYCPAGTVKLSEFMEDGLTRTGDNIRGSTQEEYRAAMEDFIKVIGNKDFTQVDLKHGEYYRQVCLDRGNAPATVTKKLVQIHRFFALAVKRRQLDENPLEYIDSPTWTKKKIRVYRDTECERMMKVASDLAQEINPKTRLRWYLMIIFALTTGFRRGEILNLVWEDIDFGEKEVYVEPKKDTETTWRWEIKDADRRTLPLTDELTQWLIVHQDKQPEGYPYVFVPPARYDHIQNELRAKGKWKFSDSRLKVVHNFKRDFDMIRNRARVKKGTFHDLRRTAICDWYAQGMDRLDVMKLAGHSEFSTTNKYYLFVNNGLIDRARLATARGLCKKLIGYGAPHIEVDKTRRNRSIDKQKREPRIEAQGE